MRGACSVQVRMEYDIHGTVLRSVLKKKRFLLNFDFGTCEEPTVNRPKGIQKTHANYL